MTLNASDYNLTKLTTAQFSDHLDYSMAAGSNLTIIGIRGGGKTSITKDRILNSKYREVYVNLSTYERVDLSGYPKVINPVDEFVDYLLPRIYEPLMKGKQPAIMLFDEADKCENELYAPLLELVQFHSLNGQKFSNLHSCILTGNLLSEGGRRIHPALLDRTEVYMLQPDVKSWLAWAGGKGQIHSSIYAYIQDHPDRLTGSEEINELCLRDPSPRSWDNGSKIIKFGEEHHYPIELILEKVSGLVGKQAGAEFRSYYQHYKVLLPLVDALFKGENINKEYKDTSPSDKLSLCLIIMARFAAQLDASDPTKDKPEVINYVGKLLQTVSPDIVVAGLRARVQSYRLRDWKLHTHPLWSKILDNMINTGEGKVD